MTQYELGDKMKVPFNSSVELIDGSEILAFKYTKLIEESRCPADATCFWAGRAVVEIEVNNDETFELGVGDLRSGTEVPIADTAFYEGYIIALDGILLDKDKNYGNQEHYTVHLTVLKN